MRGYVKQVWGSFNKEYNGKNIAEVISSRICSVITDGRHDIGALAVEQHETHIQLTQSYVLPSIQISAWH